MVGPYSDAQTVVMADAFNAILRASASTAVLLDVQQTFAVDQLAGLGHNQAIAFGVAVVRAVHSTTNVARDSMHMTLFTQDAMSCRSQACQMPLQGDGDPACPFVTTGSAL